MNKFLLKILFCVLAYSVTTFAITGGVVNFNSANTMPQNKVSLSEMWTYYKSLPEQPSQELILNLAHQKLTHEQKLAVSLYSMRWSRKELKSDSSDINEWKRRSEDFKVLFFPTFLNLLDIWNIEAFAESNTKQVEENRPFSILRFEDGQVQESQIEEISQVLKLAFTFITVYDLSLMKEGKPLSYSRGLQLLAPLVRLASEYDLKFNKALELYIESYVVEMIRAVRIPWMLNRVYPSLLAQLTIGHIERILDIRSERSEINTIDFYQTKSSLTGVALGMDSLGSNSQQHPLGFYYTVLDGISLKQTPQTIFHNWTYHNKSYQAKITARLKSSENNVIKWEHPVSKLREDGVLVGVALISPNMKKDIPNLVQQYIEYLKDNGFQLTSEANPEKITLHDIEDLFVLKGIDYVLKEAHSDGDTFNLIHVSASSQLLKAHKASDGQNPEEIFYIIFPQAETAVNANAIKSGISLRQFREWMQKRVEINKSPLIYFNSSCWSVKRSPDEISQIHSPYFINIPSFDTVSIFKNKGHNHPRAFVDGIRANLDFSEIKKKLIEQDYSKENWHRATRFLLPGDSDYEELVTSYLREYVDYQFEVADESGKIIFSR